MTLVICTARLGHYRADDALDVTRTGADHAAKAGEAFPGAPFAPSWAILGPALEARRHAQALRAEGKPEAAAEVERAAWQAYRPRFEDEMRASWRAHRAAWRELLERPRVTLLCYCPDVARCHRGILVGLLSKAASHVGGAVTYGGEHRACDRCGTVVLHTRGTMIACGRGGCRPAAWWVAAPHACAPARPGASQPELGGVDR